MFGDMGESSTAQSHDAGDLINKTFQSLITVKTHSDIPVIDRVCKERSLNVFRATQIESSSGQISELSCFSKRYNAEVSVGNLFKALELCNHANVLKTFSLTKNGTYNVIAVEEYSTTLKSYLDKSKKSSLFTPAGYEYENGICFATILRVILTGIIHGSDHIHSVGLHHGKLTLDQILLTDDLTPKLAFGELESCLLNNSEFIADKDSDMIALGTLIQDILDGYLETMEEEGLVDPEADKVYLTGEITALISRLQNNDYVSARDVLKNALLWSDADRRSFLVNLRGLRVKICEDTVRAVLPTKPWTEYFGNVIAELPSSYQGQYSVHDYETFVDFGRNMISHFKDTPKLKLYYSDSNEFLRNMTGYHPTLFPELVAFAEEHRKLEDLVTIKNEIGRHQIFTVEEIEGRSEL